MLVLRARMCQRGRWFALLAPFILASCTQEPQITLLTNEAYFDALISHLTQASQEIVISMFLFAPGDHEHNRANRVKEALIDASKRGMQVQLLLDISDDEDFATGANRGVAKELSRQGIAVRFDSSARTTHTKLVIIDRRYVFLGSHNFTHSALRHNNEASVLIESPKLAQQALTYLQGIGGWRVHERVSGTERRRPRAHESR